MCIGAVARLVESWDDGTIRLGRLEDGRVVLLAFCPDARPGSQLLLHLGVPVEVLEQQPADNTGGPS